MGSARATWRRNGSVALLLMTLTAAGCAHAPSPTGAPQGAAPIAGRPPAATAVTPSPSPAGAYRPCRTRVCVGGDPKRRQYFDERRRRYYFFDSVRKRYYWEDGTPRA